MIPAEPPTQPAHKQATAAHADPWPTPAAWAALRWCESRGEYHVVSPDGTYRGAYQFDLTTWRGVGGQGDPAAAPRAEQDLRARLLYEARGPQPWPVCGRYLER